MRSAVTRAPILLAVLLASAAAPAQDRTSAEIEFLLQRVAASGYVFIRNGKEHESASAAKHMRRKYEHFADEIASAEDFIERAATRSLLTRREYEVRLPDGRRVATAAWLAQELAAYRDRVAEETRPSS